MRGTVTVETVIPDIYTMECDLCCQEARTGILGTVEILPSRPCRYARDCDKFP